MNLQKLILLTGTSFFQEIFENQDHGRKFLFEWWSGLAQGRLFWTIHFKQKGENRPKMCIFENIS